MLEHSLIRTWCLFLFSTADTPPSTSQDIHSHHYNGIEEDKGGGAQLWAVQCFLKQLLALWAENNA